jgi:flagellar hook-associated protein 3 FlgL
MRITSDIAYNNLLRDIERISERMGNTQLQISSGKRLNKPSDDPVAASDVIRIQAEQSEVGQYQDNIATAKSRLNFADATLQGVQTMVERIRNLALISMSNLSAASQHTAEISGLREQLLSAANSTIDGQFMFAGSNVDSPAYTQASDGTVTYNGNSDVVRLQIGRAATLQVGVPGSDVFTGTVDVFATVQNLMTAMNAGNKPAIAAEVTKLEQFFTAIGSTQGKVGGLINVAQSVDADLTQYSLGRTEQRSRLEDVDMAAALTDYTQAETALRAATAVGARISNISILDYLS